MAEHKINNKTQEEGTPFVIIREELVKRFYKVKYLNTTCSK